MIEGHAITRPRGPCATCAPATGSAKPRIVRRGALRWRNVMADPRELAARFVSRTGQTASDDAALSRELARATDEARRAWPTVELADEEFVEHLAARVRPDDDAVAVL